MPSDTNETTLTAEERTEFGKGAARRVRRAHKVPAVLYGHGQAPHHISLPGHQLMLALKHGGSNALLTLKMTGGDEQMALPKAIVRDPIKGTLEHLDLLIVRRGEKVTVDVPIHTTGEAQAETLITQPVGAVSLEAEATRIPTELEVDISALTAGDNVLARDVKLPHNTTLITEGDVIVVSALAQLTAEQLEAELESTVEDVAGEPSGEGDVVPEESDGGETAAAEPAAADEGE